MTAPELLTDSDLAKAFGADEDKVALWRRTYGWPHIKVGRTVRYTAAQVEQILDSHSRERDAGGPVRVSIPGQTPRSARRRSS